MSLAFLAKKSWHTTNIKNVERVWVAEQKGEEEKKKVIELQKQIAEERQIQDLRQLQAASGHVVKIVDNTLDWMYEGPGAEKVQQQSTEDYLLGKTYKAKEEKSSDLQKVGNSAGATWLNKTSTKNDMFTRLHEDPMLIIKQNEKKNLENVLKNPLKMERIRQSVAVQLNDIENEKKDKKAAKKEAKAAKKEKKEKQKKATHGKMRSRSVSVEKQRISKYDESDGYRDTQQAVKAFKGADQSTSKLSNEIRSRSRDAGNSSSQRGGRDDDARSNRRRSRSRDTGNSSSQRGGRDDDVLSNKRRSRSRDTGNSSSQRGGRDDDVRNNRRRSRSRDTGNSSSQRGGRDDDVLSNKRRSRSRDTGNSSSQRGGRDDDVLSNRQRSGSDDKVSSDLKHSTSSSNEKANVVDSVSERSTADPEIKKYGLQRNANCATSVTDKTQIGPSVSLLAKKAEEDRMSKASRNKPRENVKKLTEEERAERIRQMECDASDSSNRRLQRVQGAQTSNAEEKSEATAIEAPFLSSMRTEVYITSETTIKDRLQQNKHYMQKSSDLDSLSFIKR